MTQIKCVVPKPFNVINASSTGKGGSKFERVIFKRHSVMLSWIYHAWLPLSECRTHSIDEKFSSSGNVLWSCVSWSHMASTGSNVLINCIKVHVESAEIYRPFRIMTATIKALTRRCRFHSLHVNYPTHFVDILRLTQNTSHFGDEIFISMYENSSIQMIISRIFSHDPN